MILLDTNVVSELMRDPCDRTVLRWFSSLPADEIGLPSIVLEEIIFGIDVMDTGRRQKRLSDGIAFLESQLTSVPFDDAAAKACAAIRADCQRRGRSIDLADSQIAGTAKARSAAIATRNVRHFADTTVDIINPWDHP